MEQSKNNNVFLPLQRGRKSLDNEACFSKLYVIRVDKATQTYGQKGIAEYCGFTAQFVENTPFPTSGPVEPAAVRLFIPGKKISTLFPDSPLLFYFFPADVPRSDLWLEAPDRAKQPSPPLVPPSHTQRFALQPNISLPSLSFSFHLFSDTWLIFICMMPSLVFCFFGPGSWSENSVLLGVEVLF